MDQGEAVQILVVDDNHSILQATERVFKREGWTVTMAQDGLEAKEKLKERTFDIIVSDITMPGYGGLEFLRAVREQDLDVPVILMTGNPSIESSIRALEYGAFRYLLKPVGNDKLVETVRQGVRIHKLALLKRQALEHLSRVDHHLPPGISLETQFARSLALVWVAFQPIVSLAEHRVLGNEALLRSDDPVMNNPGELLDAAEVLGRVHELGRLVRAKAAAATASPQSGEAALFVNLHSSDLNDEELYSADSPLSKIASRVVLEVTERASLDNVKDVAGRTAKLRKMGFKIAVDDLGAGYAGLNSFTMLEPEFVKLDMSLVRGIDADPKRQSIVRSMRKLCEELGIQVIAEGIETVAERDMLASLGCNLLQGYLFAKPERGFPVPRW